MLQVLIFAVALAAATAEEPDCSSEACKKFGDGVCYIKSEYCSAFFMCTEIFPGRFTYESMCCPAGLTFSEKTLTCDLPLAGDTGCVFDRQLCPATIDTESGLCPHREDPSNSSNYFASTGEKHECPVGQVWQQSICSCYGIGFVDDDCDKILHYQFTGNYDSFACDRLNAYGQPVNNPDVSDNLLCLNGQDQAVEIPYMANLFAGANNQDTKFTISFWMAPRNEGATSGVLSTGYVGTRVLFEVRLDAGELVHRFGAYINPTGFYPLTRTMNFVAMTFNKGVVDVYYNTWLPASFSVSPVPVNSQSPASIGFVDGQDYFDGYIDDFCFWHRALPHFELKRLYLDGPSNEFFD